DRPGVVTDEWRETELRCTLRRRHDHRRGTVGYLRRVAGVNHAVLEERRLQRSQSLDGGAPAYALVDADRAVFGGDGDDLIGECAGVDRGRRELVRPGRELIELRARQLPTRCDELGADALVEGEVVVPLHDARAVREPGLARGAERH